MRDQAERPRAGGRSGQLSSADGQLPRPDGGRLGRRVLGDARDRRGHHADRRPRPGPSSRSRSALVGVLGAAYARGRPAGDPDPRATRPATRTGSCSWSCVSALVVPPARGELPAVHRVPADLGVQRPDPRGRRLHGRCSSAAWRSREMIRSRLVTATCSSTTCRGGRSASLVSLVFGTWVSKIIDESQAAGRADRRARSARGPSWPRPTTRPASWPSASASRARSTTRSRRASPGIITLAGAAQALVARRRPRRRRPSRLAHDRGHRPRQPRRGARAGRRVLAARAGRQHADRRAAAAGRRGSRPRPACPVTRPDAGRRRSDGDAARPATRSCCCEPRRRRWPTSASTPRPRSVEHRAQHRRGRATRRSR